MLAIARDKAAAKSINNITFQQGSIDELVLSDSSLDVAMGHGILHLLENMEATIAKIYRMLKPGGLFVSSTVCLGDNMRYIKLIAAIGKLFGLMPLLKVFHKSELQAIIINVGFAVDYEWQLDGKVAVLFVVAKKTG